MRMFKRVSAIAGLTLSLFGLADVTLAQSPAPAAPRCFLSRDWSGWRGSADAKTVYIRTGVRQIYRVDLAAPCHGVEWGLSHLVVRRRGGSWICDALDLDLGVSDGHGFVNRCFVRTITPLSAEEAAALPQNLRP